MKKTLSVLILFFIAASAFAQVTQDEVGYIQSIWGKDKKDIIKEFVKLSDSEANDFWAIYDKYEEARKEIGKERIKGLSDYAQNYKTITDAQADDLVTKTFSNHTRFNELLSNTYNQMKSVVPTIKAAQFVQVEMYLETAIRLAIQGEIPVIGDIKSATKK
jgi:hypothetical protein